MFERAVVGALKARARLLRVAPARRDPLFARDLPNFSFYPGGYEIEQLGTFPPRRRAAETGE